MRQPKINLVLIVLDALRYDYWMEFANSISSSHSLIAFHNAFSTSTWTPPSHASIFTGKYPHQHGILARKDTVPPLRVSGLAHELRKLGYITLAMVGNPVATPFIGGGFQCVVEVDVGRHKFLHGMMPIKFLRSYYDPQNELIRIIRMIIRNLYYFYKDLITLGEQYYGYRIINDAVFLFLKRLAESGKPFFLFINYMDAHDYLAHTSIFNRWRIKVIKRGKHVTQAYRNGVKRLVRGLKEFMEILDEFDLVNSTVVLVTSDHGELLGEYGLMGHTHAYPYDELIHVPLTIYDPLNEDRMEVEKIFSLKDIYRLILGYALKGHFPAELLEELPDYVVFEDKTLGSRPKHYRAVLAPPYKIVYDVVNNKYKIEYLRMRERCVKVFELREAVEILKKVNKEAQMYEKIRILKRRLKL